MVDESSVRTLTRQFAGLAVALVGLFPPNAVFGQTSPANQAAALKIVVLQGEDTVNVIQQQTAVAAVVEVRDRNDQPVAGAVVTFAISSGRGSFTGGSQTLSVTTGANGRAAATGFTPGSNGPLQISASASFQGQTSAPVTISQTTVTSLTGAAATGTAAGAGAGAGSGGGIFSATSLAIIGGAAAGGVFAANALTGPELVSYTGTYSGVRVINILTAPGCTWSEQHQGTVVIDIEEPVDGSLVGTGSVSGTLATISRPCNQGPTLNVEEAHGCCPRYPTLQGTPANFSFSGNHPGLSGTTWTYEFAGTLANGQVTGTFTLITESSSASGRQSFPITLTRQGSSDPSDPSSSPPAGTR